MNDWYMQKLFNDLVLSSISFPSNSNVANLNMFLLPGQGKIIKTRFGYRATHPVIYQLFSNPYESQTPGYLRTLLKFSGTNCDSIIKTSPLFSHGLPVSLDTMDWDYNPVSDYSKPPLDTTLHPCTEDDLPLMTHAPAKFVTRWEMIDSVPKAVLYLVWNGICYCDNAENGILFQSRGIMDSVRQEDSTYKNVVTFLDSNIVLGGYSQNFPTKNPTYIGSTTINASTNRNFIAWSDALQGIGIGWQYPGDSVLNGVTYIPYVRMPNNDVYSTLMYPELNRYSRVDYGEDEAALVFVGKKLATLDDSTNQIFYTRIKVDSLGNIVHFLPQMQCNQSSDQMQYDTTGTLAMVSHTALGSRHKNPQIIRNVSQYQMPNVLDNLTGNLAIKMDRIVWEAENEEGKGIVQYSGFDFQDIQSGLNWEPYCYFTTMPTQISSMEGNVIHPSIAQGIMRDQTVINGLDTVTLKTYYNDSAMVMTFGANDSLIYHIPHNFWTLMYAGNYSLIDIPNINLLTAKGTDPVLPIVQTVKDDSLYQYMKVFYLNDSSYTQQSSQYFYKRQNFSKQYHQFFGIANKDKQTRWFTPIVLTNEQGQIENPKIYTHKQEGNRLVSRDTIVTDWFEVGTIKSIDFIEKGNLIGDYAIKVQRQRDGRILPLQNPNQSDNKFRIKTKMLLNGKNDKYRVMWIKDKENAQYVQQLVIGDISQRAELDGILEERELGKFGDVQAEEFIDLNEETYANKENILGLSVYPNPAKDELYIVCYLPRTLVQDMKSDLILKLFDNLGREVFTKEIKAGQIIRIPTDNLQTGSYVKVFQNNQTLLPAEVKNVIIER